MGNCLPEHVRNQLGQLIIQPSLYRYALAQLQRLYGSRQVIIKSFTAVLENLKPFNSNDHHVLAKLSTSLRSVGATMQLCGFDAELSSYSNVELVLRKLSPKLQDRWATAVWRQPELPTLVNLRDLVSDISMIEYTRRFGVAASSDRPSHPVKPTKPLSQLTGASSFAISVMSACEVCQAIHALSDCKQ